MKQAARSWRSKSSTKKKRKPKSTKSKRRRKTTAKRRVKRVVKRGSRIFGVGLKGLLIGSGLLAMAKYASRKYLPQAGAYTTAFSALSAGAIGGVAGTGKSLMRFGLMDGVSELMFDLVAPGGLVTFPGIAPKTSVRWDL